jgi:hypothetical protein
MNEMKKYKIHCGLKGLFQKIFFTLLPNFGKGLNKSSLKFGPFWCGMDESEQNAANI